MSTQKSSAGSAKELRVSISTNTLFRVLFLVGAVAMLFYLHNLVAILLASLLLAATIDPLADRFQKRNIPRALAAAIVYILVLAIFIGILFLIVPTLSEQGTQLLSRYAPYIEEASGGAIQVEKIFSEEIFQQDFGALITSAQQSGLADTLPDILGVLTDIFGAIITTFLIVVISFYMVVEENVLRRGVLWLAPKQYEPMIKRIVPKAQKQIGAWLRGTILIMAVIFLLNYILLLALGIPYALVLALIAGFLEIIPFLGPMLSAVPAIIIALTVSPWHALLVAIAYFGIQQFEGDILTPKVMQKIGGVNPIVSIVAIIVGWEMFGIIGALLAIPSAMVIGVLLQEVSSEKMPK